MMSYEDQHEQEQDVASLYEGIEDNEDEENDDLNDGYDDETDESDPLTTTVNPEMIDISQLVINPDTSNPVLSSAAQFFNRPISVPINTTSLVPTPINDIVAAASTVQLPQTVIPTTTVDRVANFEAGLPESGITIEIEEPTQPVIPKPPYRPENPHKDEDPSRVALRNAYSQYAYQIYNGGITPEIAYLLGEAFANKTLLGVAYPQQLETVITMVDNSLAQEPVPTAITS